jgi:hypothetical protein
MMTRKNLMIVSLIAVAVFVGSFVYQNLSQSQLISMDGKTCLVGTSCSGGDVEQAIEPSCFTFGNSCEPFGYYDPDEEELVYDDEDNLLCAGNYDDGCKDYLFPWEVVGPGIEGGESYSNNTSNCSGRYIFNCEIALVVEDYYNEAGELLIPAGTPICRQGVDSNYESCGEYNTLSSC